MGTIFYKGREYSDGTNLAEEVLYNNDCSDLTATSVQGAIDEINEKFITQSISVGKASRLEISENVAILHFNGVQITTSGTFDINIPSEYYPDDVVLFTMLIVTNGIYQTGFGQIDTNGSCLVRYYYPNNSNSGLTPTSGSAFGHATWCF